MTTPQPSTPAKPAAPRLPPVPPSLLRRIVLLVMRPEQWAEAARYRLSVTMWPVVVVSIFMSALVALAAARSTGQLYDAFAAGYDSNFYPMELREGKLYRAAAATQPATAPARALTAPTFTARIPFWSRLRLGPFRVVFDPENKEHLSVTQNEVLLHVTESEVIEITAGSESYFGGLASPDSESHFPLELFTWYAKDETVQINGSTLQNAAKKKTFVLLVTFFSTFICQFMGNLFWALLIGFLVVPMIMISAQRLMMPRLVGYRIGLAVTIPLIVIGGVLEASGVMVQTMLPEGVLPVIWIIAAMAMAFWSGVVANRIYAPRRRAPGSGT